jgi:hypothetical protein
VEIVLSALNLGPPGGVQSYLLTVAPHLERLGHQVTLFSPELGTMAEVARSRGLRVTDVEHALPDRCDAVIPQDAVTALAMADRYPEAVNLVVVHSANLDVHLPRGAEGTISGTVVMNDVVEERVRAMAVHLPVTRLRQPMDVDQHYVASRLPDRPTSVLLLGNYLHGPLLHDLIEVCADAGLTWQHVGTHGTLLADPVEAIAEADIVIGIGRSALDAMACGRAVWVFGPPAGDGWVTTDTYPAMEADGFRGAATDRIPHAADLAADLADYRPSMGADNRNLIFLHHAATQHAAGLVGAIEALRDVPPPHRPDAPLRELARAVRMQHEAQASLIEIAKRLRALQDELGVRNAELQAARDEATALRKQLANAGLAADDGAGADAGLRAEVAALTARLDALQTSRPWRALDALTTRAAAARRRTHRR